MHFFSKSVQLYQEEIPEKEYLNYFSDSHVPTSTPMHDTCYSFHDIGFVWEAEANDKTRVFVLRQASDHRQVL